MRISEVERAIPLRRPLRSTYPAVLAASTKAELLNLAHSVGEASMDYEWLSWEDGSFHGPFPMCIEGVS